MEKSVSKFMPEHGLNPVLTSQSQVDFKVVFVNVGKITSAISADFEKCLSSTDKVTI